MNATTMLRYELVRRAGPTRRNVDVVGMKEVKTEVARLCRVDKDTVSQEHVDA